MDGDRKEVGGGMTTFVTTPYPMERNKVDLLELTHPNWHRQAACKGHPPWWFSDNRDEQEKAKEVCSDCPVQKECALFGITQSDGIWAGHDVSVLRSMRLRRTLGWRRMMGDLPARSLPTEACVLRPDDGPADWRGWKAHRAAGVPTCDPCKAARAALRQEQRDRARSRGQKVV